MDTQANKILVFIKATFFVTALIFSPLSNGQGEEARSQTTTQETAEGDGVLPESVDLGSERTNPEEQVVTQLPKLNDETKQFLADALKPATIASRAQKAAVKFSIVAGGAIAVSYLGDNGIVLAAEELGTTVQKVGVEAMVGGTLSALMTFYNHLYQHRYLDPNYTSDTLELKPGYFKTTVNTLEHMGKSFGIDYAYLFLLRVGTCAVTVILGSVGVDAFTTHQAIFQQFVLMGTIKGMGAQTIPETGVAMQTGFAKRANPKIASRIQEVSDTLALVWGGLFTAGLIAASVDVSVVEYTVPFTTSWVERIGWPEIAILGTMSVAGMFNYVYANFQRYYLGLNSESEATVEKYRAKNEANPADTEGCKTSFWKALGKLWNP